MCFYEKSRQVVGLDGRARHRARSRRREGTGTTGGRIKVNLHGLWQHRLKFPQVGGRHLQWVADLPLPPSIGRCKRAGLFARDHDTVVDEEHPVPVNRRGMSVDARRHQLLHVAIHLLEQNFVGRRPPEGLVD